MKQVDLTQSQNPEWALFLPAISSFFISGLGKQREGENYFEQSRIPSAFNGDTERLNYYSSNGLFTYKWGLYSAGHANLDTTVDDHNESVVRKREENTFCLGDSGGFQILKGQWPADWKDPNCPRAMEKRIAVLKWMDTYMDYGMCLDIPSQSLETYHLTDKNGKSLHGIQTIQDAIVATHINNEYFIKNRSGKCKFLNVLQGHNHTQSDNWYDEMKKYCDPNIYPENHFNGWAFGGQNKADIHLTLRRLVHIIHDGLLQEGKHDLIHCLGTSILEYAVIFSDIQRALRKYVNPKLQITFDCASPFLSAAKGLAYFENVIEHNKKWSYRMDKTAEDKKYATDNRLFVDAVLQDNIHKRFTNSPILEKLLIRDICYRGHGFINQQGKETKTSWDTLSYTILQAHNVYQHIAAVQEANTKYDTQITPKMLICKFGNVKFNQLVDEIFSLNDRQKSLDLIDKHSKFFLQIQSGSYGYTGKRAINSNTKFEEMFDGVNSAKTKKMPTKKKELTIHADSLQLFDIEE